MGLPLIRRKPNQLRFELVTQSYEASAVIHNIVKNLQGFRTSSPNTMMAQN